MLPFTVGSANLFSETKVARWQKFIPSFPMIALGWRAHFERLMSQARDVILVI